MKIDEKDKLKKDFIYFLNKNNGWDRANTQLYNLFFNKFGKDKRTFQRWRKNILEERDICLDSNRTEYKSIKAKKRCYFCESKSNLIVHHKDKNRGNNLSKNLLYLCKKCHKRYHNLDNKEKSYKPSSFLKKNEK